MVVMIMKMTVNYLFVAIIISLFENKVNAQESFFLAFEINTPAYGNQRIGIDLQNDLVTIEGFEFQKDNNKLFQGTFKLSPQAQALKRYLQVIAKRQSDIRKAKENLVGMQKKQPSPLSSHQEKIFLNNLEIQEEEIYYSTFVRELPKVINEGYLKLHQQSVIIEKTSPSIQSPLEGSYSIQVGFEKKRPLNCDKKSTFALHYNFLQCEKFKILEYQPKSFEKTFEESASNRNEK
jgi:hypothetical protein